MEHGRRERPRAGLSASRNAFHADGRFGLAPHPRITDIPVFSFLDIFSADIV